jgi:NAD kinase
VSIKAVEDALRILGIDYEKTYRAALWDGKDTFGTPDLIIAVGGDGTFIEASRIAHGDQIMLVLLC